MELELIRNTFTDLSTIGDLFINGVHECFILEDHDRGLTSDMTLPQIEAAKKHSATCIPYGRYQVVITQSPRFKRLLPLVLNVKGFEGIRFHSGNFHYNTDGCLLPGNEKGNNMVRNSVVAFQALYEKIEDALKKEKVFITITK